MLPLNEIGGVWAEINLDHIAHNVRTAKKMIKKDTILMGVLKADGYGHGSVAIVKTLLENGVDRLAVATISEAIELRNAGVKEEILILTYTPVERASDLVKYELTPTMYQYDQAKVLSEKAKMMNKHLKIHIKIDTGMSRLGYMPNLDSILEIQRIMDLPSIEVEGIYTHFALSYIKDKSFTHRQMERFKWMVNALEAMGINIPIKHVSNSATATDMPEYNLDMVRIGSTIYGLPHMVGISKEKLDILPAMTLKARISNIRDLPKDVGVSYGLTYITPGEKRIAAIAAGYADGLTRLGSGKIQALIGGRKVNQVGIICMDQCMFDVTDLDNVNIGDEVILLGSDGYNEITADDKATILGTGNCEIVCAATRRVPRVYISNGKIVNVTDYLLTQPKAI